MRISDWSSDVCSSDLADPSTAFDRAANIAAGGRAVVHADEDRPGWSVRRRTGAGPCDPRRAGEPLWAGQAAGRAVPLLYWRARSEERREGKRVSVRVNLGGRRLIKKKKKTQHKQPK